MLLDGNSMKPIYVQIAEWLEMEILRGSLQYDDKVYSQYQLAEMFNINPATAAKGLKILADENFLYKKRGLGMFVAAEAKEAIRSKRADSNLKSLVLELAAEAGLLNIEEAELLEMVKKARLKAKEEK